MGKFKEIVFFDIETTGFDRIKDNIIQVAARKYSGGERTDELNVYINSGSPVPAKIEELTGITTERIEKEGVTPEEAADRINRFFGPAPVLGGHNIDSFDVPFLTVFLARNRIDLEPAATLDTLTMSRKLLSQSPRLVRRARNGARSMKLGDLVEQLGLAEGLSFHNAFDDVEATVRLYEYLAELDAFMRAA